MPVQNITYAETINQFNQACDEHLNIASFDSGTIDYLDASAVDRLYPFVYLRPLSAILSAKTRILGIELYCLDIPKLSGGSNVQLISDTEFYLYDIMAWFNFGPARRQQIYQVDLVNAAPVNEAFQDRVYGWVATMNVTTPFKEDFCNYPKQ